METVHGLMIDLVKTMEIIKTEIKSHIESGGGNYSAWYVGIATKPRERLFNDHRVNEKTDGWIFRHAESESAARQIEDYFVNTLGTDGGTGGGINPEYVYAYKKSSHSDP